MTFQFLNEKEQSSRFIKKKCLISNDNKKRCYDFSLNNKFIIADCRKANSGETETDFIGFIKSRDYTLKCKLTFVIKSDFQVCQQISLIS
jgi:hypothetical protein